MSIIDFVRHLYSLENKTLQILASSNVSCLKNFIRLNHSHCIEVVEVSNRAVGARDHSRAPALSETFTAAVTGAQSA